MAPASAAYLEGLLESVHIPTARSNEPDISPKRTIKYM